MKTTNTKLKALPLYVANTSKKLLLGHTTLELPIAPNGDQLTLEHFTKGHVIVVLNPAATGHDIVESLLRLVDHLVRGRIPLSKLVGKQLAQYMIEDDDDDDDDDDEDDVIDLRRNQRSSEDVTLGEASVPAGDQAPPPAAPVQGEATAPAPSEVKTPGAKAKRTKKDPNQNYYQL